MGLAGVTGRRAMRAAIHSAIVTPRGSHRTGAGAVFAKRLPIVRGCGSRAIIFLVNFMIAISLSLFVHVVACHICLSFYILCQILELSRDIAYLQMAQKKNISQAE